MLKISNGSAAQSVLIIESLLTENLLTKYLLRTKSGYHEKSELRSIKLSLIQSLPAELYPLRMSQKFAGHSVIYCARH